MLYFLNDQAIRTWLSAMGYDVLGESREGVTHMFYREAQQWGLTPEELLHLIQETYAHEREEIARPFWGAPPTWVPLAEVA